MLNDFLYGYPSYVIEPVVVGFFVFAGLLGQLAVFRLLPAQLRTENKDATVYMASIVGVIYAVLLAFIAVAAWESFNKAGEVARKEAAEAVEMTAFEDFVTEQVLAGRSIRGLYPATDPQTKVDFEAWRKRKGR
jgi:hypothetical protein